MNVQGAENFNDHLSSHSFKEESLTITYHLKAALLTFLVLLHDKVVDGTFSSFHNNKDQIFQMIKLIIAKL